MSAASVVLWVAAAAASPAAAAQSDGTPTAARLLNELGACRAIAADAERLRCFDRTAAAVVDAEQKKDIVVLDKAEVRKTKRSLFGFSLPSIKLFGDGKDDDALKQVVGTMLNSVSLPGGLIRFELEGGGVWESTEGAMVMPRKGDVVTIKAGALGSYVATAPGRRSLRVRRVR